MKITVTIETDDNTIPVKFLSELASQVDGLTVNMVAKQEPAKPAMRDRRGEVV